MRKKVESISFLLLVLLFLSAPTAAKSWEDVDIDISTIKGFNNIDKFLNSAINNDKKRSNGGSLTIAEFNFVDSLVNCGSGSKTTLGQCMQNDNLPLHPSEVASASKFGVSTSSVSVPNSRPSKPTKIKNGNEGGRFNWEPLNRDATSAYTDSCNSNFGTATVQNIDGDSQKYYYCQALDSSSYPKDVSSVPQQYDHFIWQTKGECSSVDNIGSVERNSDDQIVCPDSARFEINQKGDRFNINLDRGWKFTSITSNFRNVRGYDSTPSQAYVTAPLSPGQRINFQIEKDSGGGAEKICLTAPSANLDVPKYLVDMNYYNTNGPFEISLNGASGNDGSCGSENTVSDGNINSVEWETSESFTTEGDGYAKTAKIHNFENSGFLDISAEITDSSPGDGLSVTLSETSFVSDRPVDQFDGRKKEPKERWDGVAGKLNSETSHASTNWEIAWTKDGWIWKEQQGDWWAWDKNIEDRPVWDVKTPWLGIDDKNSAHRNAPEPTVLKLRNNYNQDIGYDVYKKTCGGGLNKPYVSCLSSQRWNAVNNLTQVGNNGGRWGKNKYRVNYSDIRIYRDVGRDDRRLSFVVFRAKNKKADNFADNRGKAADFLIEGSKKNVTVEFENSWKTYVVRYSPKKATIYKASREQPGIEFMKDNSIETVNQPGKAQTVGFRLESSNQDNPPTSLNLVDYIGTSFIKGHSFEWSPADEKNPGIKAGRHDVHQTRDPYNINFRLQSTFNLGGGTIDVDYRKKGDGSWKDLHKNKCRGGDYACWSDPSDNNDDFPNMEVTDSWGEKTYQFRLKFKKNGEEKSKKITGDYIFDYYENIPIPSY